MSDPKTYRGSCFCGAVQFTVTGEPAANAMSGLQVFEAMRQRGTVLKTVFLSAHGELASAVAAVKQGAVDWLEKPCDEATLLAAVHRAATLSQQEAAQALRHAQRLERWLHRINVRSLIVRGENDKLFPVAYAKRWGDGIRGSRVEIVPVL